MAADVIGPVQALKEGWSLFRRHHAVLLGGFFIFIFLLIVCIKIPIHYLNWALLVTIVFPLLGGLHTLFLNAARDNNPHLTDLFNGFMQPKKWFAVGWAYLTVFIFGRLIFCLIFCLIILIPVAGLIQYYAPSSSLPLTVPVLVLTTFIAVALFMDYAFTLFTAVDGATMHQARTRSQELAKGRCLKLEITLLPLMIMCPGLFLIIGYLVHKTNANAFGWPGWAAFAFGVAVATVVTLCSMAVIYVCLDQLTPRYQDSSMSA